MSNVNTGLKLIVKNTERADANLEVSWCLCKETLAIIESKKILNASLLLVVAKVNFDRHGDEELVEKERMLLRLEQGMSYIQFNRAGRYRIFATIVKNDHDLKVTIFSLGRNYTKRYYRDLINEAGEFDPPKPFLQRAMIDVEVGKEFFAPEPAAWEKCWVNLWYDRRPSNQCMFRRRKIVAYTIQPPAVAIWLLLRTLFAFIACLIMQIGGWRQVNWRVVFHPWETELESLENCNGSIFLTRREDKYGRNRSVDSDIVLRVRPWAIPFMPYFAAAIVLLAGTIGVDKNHFKIWQGLFCWMAATAIWILFLGIIKLWPKLFKGGVQSTGSKLSECQKRDLKNQRALKEQISRLSNFACQGPDSKENQQQAQKLPAAIRLRLSYQALKAKVCRPYAQ